MAIRVVIISFWLRAKRKWWFLLGSFFLLFFRNILESMGGCSIIIELPLLIVIIVFAVKYLVNPNKYLISQNDDIGYYTESTLR